MISYFKGGKVVPVKIGNRVADEIAHLADEWKLFKDHRPDLTDLSSEAAVAVPLINRILAAPRKLSLEEIQAYLEKLFTLSDDEFQKIATIALRLREPIEISIKKLFFTWKRMIERTMIEYAKQKGTPIPRIKDKTTSSPIMYYMLWDRAGGPVERMEIFGEFEYDYKGYCPGDAFGRLRHLLTFPIQKLFDATGISGPPTGIAKLIKECYIDFEQPVVSIERPPKGSDTMRLMDAYIAACTELSEYLIAKELYYTELAQKIDVLSQSIWTAK